ncbi:MAG: hypothetical protein ACI3XE_05070 [Eubacteriales bacterium]
MTEKFERRAQKTVKDGIRIPRRRNSRLFLAHRLPPEGTGNRDGRQRESPHSRLAVAHAPSGGMSSGAQHMTKVTERRTGQVVSTCPAWK